MIKDINKKLQEIIECCHRSKVKREYLDTCVLSFLLAEFDITLLQYNDLIDKCYSEEQK